MEHSLSFKDEIVKYYLQGEGEALIFVHSWPTNLRLWQKQVEALQHKYRILTFDWVGFGKSTASPTFEYTFPNMSQLMEAVIQEAFGAKAPIIIVAHDIGGPPAILWADIYTSRVKYFILLNTVIYPFSTPLDSLSHATFKIPILKDIIASTFDLTSLMKFLGKNNSPSASELIQLIRSWQQHSRTAITMKSLLDPLHHGKKHIFPGLASLYKKIEANKFLIIGEKDPLCFAHIDKLSQENPSVPTIRLKHSGHFVPLDMPQELNVALEQILN